MINHIDNTAFLQALFGDAWAEVHVCSFRDDPSAIAEARRGICWSTGYYGPWANVGGLPSGNQYFDIATFIKTDEGLVRRRKALFLKCHVFVLDDVEEKLDVEVARRLPKPTWVLRTSSGSYQWGYILDPSIAGRFLDYTEAEICNAQDFLIESELAPSGKDPGMRGVTRLVRLPDGWNNKASRLVDGWAPFKCELTEWHPERRVSLEQIVHAIVPDADISAPRHEAATEGQQIVSDHPVLAVVDVLNDKGGGVYDVVCPNIENHTDHDTSGTAIWTYPDGKAGIKCHHGSCLEFNGAGLMAWCRDQEGWAAAHANFVAVQSAAAFRDVGPSSAGESGQELIPATGHDPWIGQHQILENVVTITEGGGGYFNFESRAFISSARVIDASYAHLVDGMLPSTWLRGQHSKEMAQGVGWYPSSERYVYLDDRKLVNTYVPPSTIPVRDDALLVNWLELCKYIYGRHVDQVLDHIAFTLQHPDRKIRWQILTVGKPRTGKTLSLEPLNRILGSASKVVDQDSASETWGDVYARKKVIIYEEVANKDKQHFNRLKSKLANSELESLNIKTQGYLEQMNLYSIYMFTNNDDALEFDSDQDKLLVIRAPDEKLDLAFYQGIGGQIDYDPKFLSAAYYYLLNRDISEFQYSALPERTEAMFAMCKAARNQAVTALLSALKHGDGPFRDGLAPIGDIKKWLRDSGYRMSQDLEVSRTLIEGGWAKRTGVRKFEGKVDSRRFWAPLAATENLSARELHDLYVTAKGGPFGL